MKTNNFFIGIVLMAALSLTACVQDLNTKPIDKNSKTTFNQDAMFTKCYATLALVGQKGPGDDSDVADIDVGTSGFYRTIWYCNELTTDEAWWIWNDAESKEMCITDWSGTNTMVRAIYTRLNLDIKYCNHYISNATQDNQEEKYRMAEVRFLRALNYFYLLDMFFYAPFCEDDSPEYPHYIPRHELYQWMVKELTEIEPLLPDQRISDYRVGKAAAQLLLARIYLNADVYNKYNKEWTANDKNTWKAAYDAASRVITDNTQHSLVLDNITTDSAMVYTAYQQLFMGNNNRPEVMKEVLLSIYQDAIYAQSYAGSMMLIGAPRIAGMTPWGLTKEWHAMRGSPTLVDKFIEPLAMDRNTAAEIKADEYAMPAILKDDRAIFCSYAPDTDYKTFAISGKMGMGDNSNLFDCWVPLKFTGVYSTAALPKLFQAQSQDWPDTDIPLLRLAEAYMIKAEAAVRMNNLSEAADIVNNTIRARAHADALPAKAFANEDEALKTMCDEWSREFYWEGRRRIDLVRLGRFFGKEADQHRYHWEGRMGKMDGMPLVTGTPEYMNWFPVPFEDKKSNPNFKTDVEGDSRNEFAAAGGDGYPY